MAPDPTLIRLQRRLLKEIREIQEKPYPGIELYVNDADLSKACLILAPIGEPPLHLTIFFHDNYPLEPPAIQMDSDVSHPNVMDTWICTTLLKVDKDYSPAYTLKGLLIQMLSFFASEKIEQEYGYTLDRKEFQREEEAYGRKVVTDDVRCKKCGFGYPGCPHIQLPAQPSTANPDATVEEDVKMTDVAAEPQGLRDGEDKKEKVHWRELVDLPAELLLVICDYLETEDLLLAAQAWNGFRRTLRKYNIIRSRELQCFLLKDGFRVLDLGVGVNVPSKGAIGSEFDIISRQAYSQHHIRKSVQGLDFKLWLPLPISESHWARLRGAWIDNSLDNIAREAEIKGPLDTAIYAFMNNIVVRLSKDAEDLERPGGCYRSIAANNSAFKSSLTHASEKAVESFFHLFHLLLCLATDRPEILNAANQLIYDFQTGTRDKERVPDLGHLLIATLISDVEVTEDLTKDIIIEAITRNVVWMLTRGYPELAFLETNSVSMYRIQKTFEASKTSYRLLMFGNLMSQVVRKTRTKTEETEVDGQKVKINRKMTLQELRNDMFARHGAPPDGTATFIANKVRAIQKIDRFDDFLKEMDLAVPNASAFTTRLRSTVKDSMERGFSFEALKQEEALYLRLQREGSDVERPEGMRAVQPRITWKGGWNFFLGQGGDRGDLRGRGDRRGGRRRGRN